MPAQAAQEGRIQSDVDHITGYQNTGTAVAILFRFAGPHDWAGLVVASQQNYWGDTPGRDLIFLALKNWFSMPKVNTAVSRYRLGSYNGD